METSDNNTKIELLIRKDNTTEKLFALSQCDYNFSTHYYQEEQDPMPIEVNLSGGIKEAIDPLFIQWISNQPGKWSGSLKIYHDNSDQPTIELVFEEAVATGCSQSFTEYNTQLNEAYFNTILKGVVYNSIPLS